MKKFIIISVVLWIAVSCTDLHETPFSDYTIKSYYTNDEALLKALIPAYSKLRNYTWAYWNLVQVSSNETAVTGQHVFDFHRNLFAHTFRPGDENITQVWDWIYEGIGECNNALYIYNQLDINPGQKRFIAEAKVLRAFYYYLLMDTFGNAPLIITYPAPKNLSQASRNEIFQFCENELKEAIQFIPKPTGIRNPTEYGRVNQTVAYTILAKLYLNAEVYINQAKWIECQGICEKIIKEDFSLSLTPNYFDNFKIHNENSREIIFPIVFSSKIDLGFPNNNFYMRTLHYNQMPVSPWNGFCTIAELYDSFDDNDIRREVLWEGQQFEKLTWPRNSKEGNPIRNRQGNQLSFKKYITSTGNSESDGIRVPKYEPDITAPPGQAENDFAIFRFSDVLLMHSEALFMQNKNSEAIYGLNKVRERALLKPLTKITISDILLERQHELFWEGFARQDLIRMNEFNNPNSIRSKRSAAYKTLFPIPEYVLEANTSFKQNVGY